jgi:hypothetical protein
MLISQVREQISAGASRVLTIATSGFVVWNFVEVIPVDPWNIRMSRHMPVLQHGQ